MSDKTSAALSETARPSGLAMAALALLAVAIVALIAAAAPYLFAGATLDGEIAQQIKAATGLRIVTSHHARFVVLPSPHVEMTDVRLADPDAGLAIDAGAFDGDIRLLPLIVGRLELDSATLTRPKLAIDLDAETMSPDSTIGRALRGVGPAPGDADTRLGTVTLVDGTAVLKSKRLAHLPEIDEIDATIDWPDVASPATLTGSLVVDGTAADIAAWVAKPSSLMRGETSPIALRIHAAPLDLSANGDLTRTETTAFRGHMALTAPSLSALLSRLGIPVPRLAPFADAALTSDATVSVDHSGRTAVDLPGLSLDLDGNHYDGTLAYESGARPSLSGTLATDTLTLAPFLAREPSLADAEHRWTRTALLASGADAIDLDLRISATHLRVAPFTIDDAALSVMTRGARTELALNDGKAYGGAIKARASIGDHNGVLSLRAAGTLADADLAGLAWDALGRQIAIGTLAGSLNVETSGDSSAALMAHLQGWAKWQATDGELSGIDLGRSLSDLGARRARASIAALRRGRTAFTDATLSLKLADGVATIAEATLTGPRAAAAVTGSADIGNRTLDLDATASPPPGATPSVGERLSIAVTGSFDAPVAKSRPEAAPAASSPPASSPPTPNR